HWFHPLGTAAESPHFIFTKGEGVYLWDIDGNKYMDLSSGGVHICNLGHSHPKLIEAATEQMKEFSYYSAGAPTASNIPAIEYCNALAEVLPAGIDHVYLTCTGTESTESCIQIARAYWESVGDLGKYKIICLDRAYHGASQLARSMTGAHIGLSCYSRRNPEVVKMPNFVTGIENCFKTVEENARYLEQVIQQEGADTISCLMAEVAQGNGGVVWPGDEWWPITREICTKHNILLIADEVQTGFCRTGKFWGLDHYGVVPDMVSMAKGINSGILPFGAVGFSNKIFGALVKSNKRLMSYTTSDGNAVVVATAMVALKIYKEGMAERVTKLGAQLSKRLNEFTKLPVVDAPMGKGLYQSFLISLNKTTGSPYNAEATTAAREYLSSGCLKQGVMLTYCDGYPHRQPIVPPFIITEEELDHALDVIYSVLKEIKPV
ncbi:MAG: aminotransferase class III-fold pyridoxal phosphate-dependent enzyme, partial [Dehalococcoidales bacterium]|nr:aminotransferase class III-fold pyridoxal phosphate-dependent enzyme [Dehalococcoidales bacterium]